LLLKAANTRADGGLREIQALCSGNKTAAAHHFQEGPGEVDVHRLNTKNMKPNRNIIHLRAYIASAKFSYPTRQMAEIVRFSRFGRSDGSACGWG
jgi:hypothetical protein